MMNRFSNLRLSEGLFRKAGMAFIAVSVFILGFTYYPAVKEEIRYAFNRDEVLRPVLTRAEAEGAVEAGEESSMPPILPVDENFGIVIPKIGANASIVPDVDWRESAIYQRALTRGVAHARGTSRPGGAGNMFLFAHSGVDFYEAARYNAVFYLINKLESGDAIDILYQGKKYAYAVTEKKLVGEAAVEYLESEATGETLTLMTCWPPGTTVKRLIVRAERQE